MICYEIVKCFANQSNCPHFELSNNSQIVSFEKKKRYCLLNSDNSLVAKIRIDGGCIRDNDIQKCDYLYEFNDNRNGIIGIFIELKGSDFYHAIEQIGKTLDCYSSFLNKCFARIVCSSGAGFKNADAKVVALKKRLIKLGGNFKCFTNTQDEEINTFR